MSKAKVEKHTHSHKHMPPPHTHKHTLPEPSPPPRTTSTKTKNIYRKHYSFVSSHYKTQTTRIDANMGPLIRQDTQGLSSLHQVQCKNIISISLELEFQVYVSYPVKTLYIKVQSLLEQGILLTSEQCHLFQHRRIFLY